MKKTLADVLKSRPLPLGDMVVCPAGGGHDWEYRGPKTQLYVCHKCGFPVLKSELKEATEVE